MSSKDTVDLRYLKIFLVGPPGVGKTTTLDRLLKAMTNLCSIGRMPRSTLLANCIQVFAFVSNDGAEWISSGDLNKEAVLLFRYLCGCKLMDGPHEQSDRQIHLKTRRQPQPIFKRKPEERLKNTTPRMKAAESIKSKVHEGHEEDIAHKATVQHERIGTFVDRLQKVIKSIDDPELFHLLGSTLLSINDIGGQPGFLEMLPALSTGPAMYLVFLDLSKKLDKPYKIPFSRDDTVITPYPAMHTVESTISQILSAITSVHCLSQETSLIDTSRAGQFDEKFKNFQEVRPVAALIGTHKDEVQEPVEQNLKVINDNIKRITRAYSQIVINPSLNKSFFAVDNMNGTEEVDIGPIRNFMNKSFHTHFKKASLPIRPKWLWFSLILRREYKIVSMVDCLDIAQLLGMEHDEVGFALWYLHYCTGTLLYYPDIQDEWFKDHIICSPQVVFDSISQFIVVSLRILHSGNCVVEQKRAELIKKGQFSIDSIKEYCLCDEASDNLIPAKQLVQLLNHVNLLSPITHTKEDGTIRITYLMPAVLECATANNLPIPPPADANNPEPLYITFSCGYTPTGTFCGLITRLVSEGPSEIFGLKWELVEEGVKRNCVSFYINILNKVTLISHDRCYELQVTCNDPNISLHDLCTHILSVVLYTLKNLYKNLVPQISFQCPCLEHSSGKNIKNLCTLTETRISVVFTCGRKHVTLRDTQQVWLGKVSNTPFLAQTTIIFSSQGIILLIQCVTPGSYADLEALKFAESGLLFNWNKVRSRHQILPSTDSYILIFSSVSENDFGYYRCEVKEREKVILTVYRALYRDTASRQCHLGKFTFR